MEIYAICVNRSNVNYIEIKIETIFLFIFKSNTDEKKRCIIDNIASGIDKSQNVRMK